MHEADGREPADLVERARGQRARLRRLSVRELGERLIRAQHPAA